MSNFALSLTGDQITWLTQDKRRELAAQWGSRSTARGPAVRRNGTGRARLVPFRRAQRPVAC